MNKQTIFTVGYTLFQSGLSLDVKHMFDILRNYKINYLVDVRSVPYSHHFPQANADELKNAGKQFGIPYVHMPEVGAKVRDGQDVFSKASDIFFNDVFPIAKSNRPEKTELFKDDEIVDFNKFRTSDFFISGLNRIEKAYDKGFNLCLMCSEKNPVECHRYFLISRALEKMFGDWLQIKHIIQDDTGNLSTATNSEINDQLKRKIFDKKEIQKLGVFNQQVGDIFGDNSSVLDIYYGNSLKDREDDFCDRYWNLLHGWKNVRNFNVNTDYD